MRRNFRLFVCSYLISGKLLNLELNFSERPLLSEIRARVVNAFRAEEAALIDRGQSIGYDVAAMFIFSERTSSGATTAPPPRSAGDAGGMWRVLTGDDIIEGLQIYAQPRLSTSILHTICDSTSEALEYQRIPPPRRPVQEQLGYSAGGATREHSFHDPLGAAVNPPPLGGMDRDFLSNTSAVSASGHPRPAVPPRQLKRRGADDILGSSTTASSPRGTRTTTMVMSSDDENDDDDAEGDDNYDVYHGGDAYEGSTTDIALAECWDEAVRRLFRELDDDCDGLIALDDLPATLERIAAGTADPTRPELFPANYHRRRGGAGGNGSSLVDEQSFISFCNQRQNVEMVSGLLAFIHSVKRQKAATEFERSMMRPGAPVASRERNNLSTARQNSNYGYVGGPAQHEFEQFVQRQWNSPLYKMQ